MFKKLLISVACIILFFVAFAKSPESSSKDEPTTEDKYSNLLKNEEENVTSIYTPSPTPTVTATATATASSRPTTATPKPTTKSTSSPEASTKPSPSVATTSAPTSAYHKVQDYDAYFETEYSHVSDGLAVLGNNEYVTVQITGKPKTLTSDDFIILYDDSLLSVSYIKSIIDDSKNEVELTYQMTGLAPANSTVLVTSSYDLDINGENAQFLSFDVQKLNSSDGTIVYVTYSGDKYHYSKSCAGDNWIATTLYDALAAEYEPCGKCAK